MADLAAAMEAIQIQNTSIQTAMGSLAEIKPMVVELTGWKAAMNKAEADLHEEMGELRHQVQQIIRNPELLSKPMDLQPLLPTLMGLLVFLNITDKIRKRTENTDVALHPEEFQGIDFHRERVC
mgnify:CR=1 FL=1